MLAAQLREEIGYAPSHSWIPSSVVCISALFI